MAQSPKTTVGRESDKFMLRFPEGMRDRITELAKQKGRSMNAEIIARLEASFSQEEGLTDQERQYLLYLAKEFRKHAQLDLFPSKADDPQPDLALIQPDGSVAVFEVKTATTATDAKTEPPQRKLRNTGRKALATAGLQSGKVELPELPEIKRGIPKPSKKKA